MMMRVLMTLLPTVFALLAGPTLAQDDPSDRNVPSKQDPFVADIFRQPAAAANSETADPAFGTKPSVDLPQPVAGADADGAEDTPAVDRPRTEPFPNRSFSERGLEPSESGGAHVRFGAQDAIEGFDSPRFFGGSRTPEGPAGRDFAGQLNIAVQSVNALKARLKQGSAEERRQAQNELEAALHRLFDIRTQMRESQIAALEKRIQTLRNQMQERVEKKSAIVQLRLQTLVYEANGLAF